MAVDPLHPRAVQPVRCDLSRTVRAGFTVIELLLAMAVSSMVGLVVVMMLMQSGTATDRQHDTRRASVQRQVATVRLGELMRETAMVVGTGSRHVVLWKQDVNGNGQPELSELRRIEWDDETGEVWVYESPPDLPESEDETYLLNPSVINDMTRLRSGTSKFPGQVRLTGITGWELALDDEGDILAARLLRLRVTLEQESGPDEATVVAALRLEIE